MNWLGSIAATYAMMKPLITKNRSTPLAPPVHARSRPAGPAAWPWTTISAAIARSTWMLNSIGLGLPRVAGVRGAQHVGEIERPEPERHRQGHHQDPEIEPQGPALDVADVHRHALLPRDVVAAEDHREAGQPGQRGELALVPGGVQ